MFETKPKKTLEYMIYVNAKYSLLKAILMQLLKGQLKIFFLLLKVDLPHHVVKNYYSAKMNLKNKKYICTCTSTPKPHIRTSI